MSVTRSVKAGVDRLQYAVKWLLINLYGPAQQDRSVDPIERLKREHGRDPGT